MTATQVVEPSILLEQLTEEHRRLDALVRSFEKKPALTPAEQIEYSRLKKQKLRTKDRIARLRT